MTNPAENKASRSLSEGQIIRDTYEVERFLGEGAFAEVYRVKHRFLGRQAMKVFRETGMTLKEIEEILGEAILLTKIGHPNIIRVFDANVFETRQGMCGYFTMENVPGGSLDRFWHSHGPTLVPVETAVDLLRQVCRGLAVGHREKPPIIHRDIKPQNILVGYEVEGLRARVSDFGLAKKVNPLTLAATSAGTLVFKPPEAFALEKGDSCAADVWGIGATLYLILTDNLPYEIDPVLGWSNKEAFKKAIIPPSQLNVGINSSLEKIILQCLEKNPARRIPNAIELSKKLENWSSEEEDSKTVVQASQRPKLALGELSPVDQLVAQKMAREALSKAKEGRLAEAADLMEESFNKEPSLRGKYAHQVRLWRCGISM